MKMPNIDPGQLLKALAPLLDKYGGMRDTEAATRIVSLMKDTTKLVSKCVYINICLSTKSEDVLQKFITSSGWNMLNKWLQEAKESDNMVFVLELLKVYQSLPVSLDDLKKDNTARCIKGFTKHADPDIQKLSTSVVDSWMKKVKGKSGNDSDNDKSKKKKKKDKDREKDRDKEKDKDREKEKDRHRHKSSDKKDSSHHNSKINSPHSLKKDSSQGDKKNSGDSAESVHKERNNSDSKEDNSENAEARLACEDGVNKSPSHTKLNSTDREEEEEKAKRKPKTARVFSSKFRSVFEEDEPLPPIKKKTSEELKGPLPLPKRNSSDAIKEEPPEKIPRLTLKMPLHGAESVTNVSPTSTSPPEITHGRIKIIPPKRPPAHEIHDSNVFMNELTKASYTHGTIKRKKKPPPPSPVITSSKQPVLGTAVKTPLPTTPTPTTPTTPVSPLTATAQKLPSVPSFYRDTLEAIDNDVQTNASNYERSPPPLEKMDTSEPDEATMNDKALENSEPPTIEMEPATVMPTEMTSELDTSIKSENGDDVGIKDETAETTPILTEGDEVNHTDLMVTGGTALKKAKKRVSWAEESQLKQVFYFELDETERENVNRPKTFSELKKQDMKSEGKAMECAKRMIKDNMVEVLPWRRPPLIDSLSTPVDLGCNSLEKGIQQQRESSVLQALFFTKQMLPDSPSEPELESVEPSQTKVIPLLDETSSAEEYEHTYNVDPSNMPYDPGFDITQNFPSGNMAAPNPGGGMGNIQLPPDLNNMLASIQQQSIATGGQSLQANSAVMANVQNILASLMHGGQGNSEELINKLRVALEPLKNQISMPMQVMNPNEAQFRPQGPGPQRHGLLGNAPPGYNPMMGPRSFGPQGPGMGGGGNMEGDWNNMNNMNNMGNMQGPDMGMRGPMGPGFHPMQGPLPGPMPGPMQGPGPGMGSNGPVMPGPRMRNNRRIPDRRTIVCRHVFTPSGCRFGNNCTFLHPGINGPPPPPPNY